MFNIIWPGQENYENQMKYGCGTFIELENLQKNGFDFQGIKHSINVVCCCDWKAGACIEGNVLCFIRNNALTK